MEIVDAIGNKVMKGNKLYWTETKLYVDVLEVVTPTEDTPGGVVIGISLPVPFDKSRPIAQLSPFIRVVDPLSEQLVSKMAGGQ